MVKIVDLAEEKRKKIEKEKELTDIIVKELPIKVEVNNTEYCSTIFSLEKKRKKPIIVTDADKYSICLCDENLFNEVNRAAKKYEKKINKEMTIYTDYSKEVKK